VSEKKTVIRGSLILNGVLFVVCIVLGFLLYGKARRIEVEQRVDTLTLAQYPVQPQTQVGRAFATIDTLWCVGEVALPPWSIQYVEHQHSAVKVIVVKPEEDSTLVSSATYFAPDGFRLYFEHDSLRLDTFPQTKVSLPVMKSKLWTWELGVGVSYRDTTLSPALRAGGHLGDLQIGRLRIGWNNELEWDLHWPICLSSYLTFRF